MSAAPTGVTEIDLAITFLRRNVLRNIVLLKLIRAYSATIRCVYRQRGAEAGVLLLLPTSASPFDAATYPQSSYIVLLSASSPAIAEALLDTVPSGEVVFKIAGTDERDAVLRRFPVRRTTAYISYTSVAGAIFPSPEHVLVTHKPDPWCLPLYAAQGHHADWLEERSAAGELICCTRFEVGNVVATCFAFCNYEQVWEIGGVYTSPEVRRQGHGRAVVAATLHELSARGLVPRYQFHELNEPSRWLAESLGLVAFGTTEHFVRELT